MMKQTVLALSVLATAFCSPAHAGGGEEDTGWNCRNYSFEIGCEGDTCTAADAFTPMDIHVTDDEVSFCAYTGCWQGAPTSVAHAGRFTTYTGLDLDFSSQSSWTADAVLSIDTQTGTGTILVADIYAQPVTCTPWSPPQE